VLGTVALQGCAFKGLTVFETIDAGVGGVPNTDPELDGGVPVCIDDPDASSDPRVCPPGCTGAFRDHAYLICTVQASWPVAETDCEAHGMRLVRIDDAAENAWVHQVAFTYGVDRNWLGGSDLGQMGDWRWADGTQFWSGEDTGTPVGGRYANWESGEPNDYGDDEHCLVMFNKATWNDDSCSAIHRYVCEAP
jgi:hypothetical protein